MPLSRILDGGKVKPVTEIPYESQYNEWRARLSDEAYSAIMQRFNELIDEKLATRDPNQQVHTAGWIPGSDWSGTVWDPIYRDAARGDHTQSALCFGLLCLVAFMNRPEQWYVLRANFKDGREIGSNTYFLGRA